jgi:hypothetical protein
MCEYQCWSWNTSQQSSDTRTGQAASKSVQVQVIEFFNTKAKKQQNLLCVIMSVERVH